jgi:hypothetical protein
VDFLGIWDTVKAYGWIIPKSFPALRHNHSVRTVRHACALDEHRALFQMTGWAESHPDVKEVWFAGDHGDVGGGHKDGNSALTEASLFWMLGEAVRERRLLLKPEAHDAIKAIANASTRASGTRANSLWIPRGFILLDLFPRQELDNALYPPLRPWRVLALNGVRKPGDHSFHNTVLSITRPRPECAPETDTRASDSPAARTAGEQYGSFSYGSSRTLECRERSLRRNSAEHQLPQ